MIGPLEVVAVGSATQGARPVSSPYLSMRLFISLVLPGTSRNYHKEKINFENHLSNGFKVLSALDKQDSNERPRFLINIMVSILHESNRKWHHHTWNLPGKNNIYQGVQEALMNAISSQIRY